MNPTRLNLYITTYCNLSCKHCCIGRRLVEPITMTFDRAFRTASYFIQQYNLSELAILGGEPAAISYFPDLVQKLRKTFKGKLIVITNGQFFQPFKMLSSTQLDLVSVSLDGASPETHDFLRGKGTFTRAITTLRHLLSAKYTTSVIFTVHSGNMHEVKQAIDLFDSLGVNELNLHVVSSNGNSQLHPDLMVHPENWRALRRTLENVAPKNGLTIRFPLRYATPEEYDREIHQGYQCLLTDVRRLHVFPDGRIYGCCLFLDAPLHSYDFTAQLSPHPVSELSLLRSHPNSSCIASEILGIGISDSFVPLCVHWKKKISPELTIATTAHNSTNHVTNSFDGE